MALYHLTAKVVGRGGVGRSVVAAAAYRARERLRDARAGRIWDHRRRRGDLVHAELLLPAGAPAALRGREALWNAVEARERRADARLAREFEVALPRELSPEQRLALVRGWAGRELVGRWGAAVDVAVHAPRASDGGEQPHAHLLATDRTVGPGGLGAAKIRGWNRRAVLAAWRASWAAACNAALAAAGHAARVDHRPYAARDLPLVAQAKLGPAATALEARGVRTARGDLRRAARAHNGRAADAMAERAAAAAEAAALGAEAAATEVQAIGPPNGHRRRWPSPGAAPTQPRRLDIAGAAPAEPRPAATRSLPGPWTAGTAGRGGPMAGGEARAGNERETSAGLSRDRLTRSAAAGAPLRTSPQSGRVERQRAMEAGRDGVAPKTAASAETPPRGPRPW